MTLATSAPRRFLALGTHSSHHTHTHTHTHHHHLLAHLPALAFAPPSRPPLYTAARPPPRPRARLVVALPSHPPRHHPHDLLLTPLNPRFATPASRRAYSRNPLQAEHEANTVRGNRAARSRAAPAAAPTSASNHTSSRSPASASRAPGADGGGGPSSGAGGRGGGGGGSSSLFASAVHAWRSTPTKWYPIPVLLGAVVLVGVQARRNYLDDERAAAEAGQTGGGGRRGKRAKIVDEDGRVVGMKGPWTVYVMGALPLNAISRAWGWANNLTLPVWFRPFGFRLYAWIFGCDLDEMRDPDLTHYRSLGEFFYRELKEGVRPIHDAALVSPADGKVLHFGRITDRRVEQVKGITYSLGALLGHTSDPLGVEQQQRQQQQQGDDDGDLDDEAHGHERFASVNGIEYSLDRLLGEEPPEQRVRRETRERRQRKLTSWTWWKSWVVRGGKPSASSTELAATGDAEHGDDDDDDVAHEDASVTLGSVRGGGARPSAPSGGDETIEDVALPMDDSVETIGRYANVAYDMGSGALPPSLSSASSRRRRGDAIAEALTTAPPQPPPFSPSSSARPTAAAAPASSASRGGGSKTGAPGVDSVREGNQLFFCVIYLAPGDYHRFHSPASWVIERRRHFRGELFSVSPYIAHRLQNYMVLNERLALLGRWRYGSLAFVPVGATNVGSITLNFDRKLRTNVREDRGLAGTYVEASYASASRVLGGLPMLKGDEMGGFHLGSTVVLIVEAPEDFKWCLSPGQKIRVGEPLGDVGGVDVGGATPSGATK